MQRLQGRAVIVTGGTSGIGLAAAQRLANEGARCVVVGRNPENTALALQSLSGEGHLSRVCDLSNEEDAEALMEDACSVVGNPYAVVLCAGSHIVRPLQVSRAKVFSDMYNANVLTAMTVVRSFVRRADRNDASITLVSSAAALRGGAGVVAYASAKGALISATRALAAELAPRRIRVNVVVPGVVETRMTTKFLSSLPLEQAEQVRASHPLGLGRPEDVAAAIAFLVSPDARWITGAELLIDGGLTCR